MDNRYRAKYITHHEGNANQNHNERSPHTCKDGCYKKKHETSVGQDVEKRDPLCGVGGEVNKYGPYGKLYTGSSKKKKKKLSYDLGFYF